MIKPLTENKKKREREREKLTIPNRANKSIQKKSRALNAHFLNALTFPIHLK